MIEGELVQLHDVCTSTLVVTMAALTSLFSHLVFSAVKSCVGVKIFFNFLVTVNTESRLAIPIETVVAIGTLMLQFGMALG